MCNTAVQYCYAILLCNTAMQYCCEYCCAMQYCCANNIFSIVYKYCTYCTYCIYLGNRIGIYIGIYCTFLYTILERLGLQMRFSESAEIKTMTAVAAARRAQP